jgi:hypothetical protein
MNSAANEVRVPVPGIDTSAPDLTEAQRILIRGGLLRASAQTGWVLERMLSASKQDDARRLAFEIATEAAISAIECSSLEVEQDGEKWLDVSDDRHDTLADLCDEIAFLAAIGRLCTHPTNQHLVRMVEAQ